MRSSTFTMALLASVAVPVLAAPINHMQRRSAEVSARANESRAIISLTALLAAVVGGAGSAVGAAGVNALFDKRETFIEMTDAEVARFKQILAAEQVAAVAKRSVNEPRAIISLTALLAAVAGGAGSALGAEAISGLFGRELQIEMTDAEAALLTQYLSGEKTVGVAARGLNEPRAIISLSALLAAVVGGAGAAVGENVISGLFERRESSSIQARGVNEPRAIISLTALLAAVVGGAGSAVGAAGVNALFERSLDVELSEAEASRLVALLNAEKRSINDLD